ncbi:uncharacterized protein [Amphiura filiformis]|uniref:uncharacterized protein isoform X1 n=1 Tax=Amphiura filiformis TaxID=82378 RepID=UPI003B227761
MLVLVWKDTTQDDESLEDDNLSDYSIQKEGQKADCVFRPTDTEKNRKLYRPTPSGPCQCPFCSRWLQGLENMRAHIRGHTGEKPYLCCHCDQKSAHFAAIKRHLMKVHKLKRPVMPGDVTLLPKSKKQSGAPKLMVKFKNVGFPSNPLKPTQTVKFKPVKPLGSSSAVKKSMVPFTGRDRSLTAFYRNFYTVNKSDELKKFKSKKDPVTKLFHCNFCGKQFNYHTEAQVHTRTHTGEKPYACLICEYKGSQWTNIVRHITCVHKLILEARQREEGIGNLPPAESEDSQLNRSSSGGTPQRVMSPEANKNYDSPLDLATSSKSHADYESPKGPDMASSKQEADYMFNPSEEEQKRVILPSPRTGLYSCLHCKKKVPNLGKIVTHLRTHSGDKPYICLHCNFKSAYKFVMKQHLSGRHSLKNPKQLSTGADGNDGMESPSGEMQMNIPSAAAAPATLTTAGHQTGMTAIKSDFRFQPSEREITSDLKRQEKTGCFECPYCGRQFSSSETIKAHIRGHTGDKAYYCNHCTFASAHIKSIRNHIQKVHMITHPRRSEDHEPPPLALPPPPPPLQRQQQHQPQHQQQRVISAAQIPKEIYLKYVGVRKTGPKKFPPKRNPRTGRFKCHFCTMESKQLYTVEIHTMRHTGEKPYECKLCEYKATRQWLVTQHLQTNHKHILAANEGLTLIPKETMKPPAPTAVKLPLSETVGDGIVVCRSAKTGLYYCSECRKEFMTSSQCREHINTHSGDKQYQCPFCEHRSAHGGAMRNHMKIQHGNDSDELKKWYTYTMGSIALRHTFQRDQDGLYMCTYCNKKSSSLNSARKHLCVHTGEKPYSCKLCPFKAIHNISIRLHVTGHHKQITSTYSQSEAASTATQPSVYEGNVGSEGRMEEQDDDEDDWEEQQALEDQMASKKRPNLGNMEEDLQQYAAASPPPVVPPVGQVAVKDADFLYVPSDVDKELVLQRSVDSQMYECPICNKQMTNTRTMRAHIRLHKGEKAYHCCHCDYKSAHYSVLRKHVVQVHKIQRPRMAQDSEDQEGPWTQQVQEGAVKNVPSQEEEMSNIDDLQLDNPSKIPTNMNPDTDSGFLFDANEDEKLSWQELQSSGSCQCPQCGKQCSSPIRTLQHMRTHSGAKPYHCRYCSFRSAYDTSMRNHVRTMHETGGAWASATAHKSNGIELEGDEELEANATLSEIQALEQQTSAPTQVKMKKEPQDNGYENKSSDVDSETPEMAWTFNEEDQSATLVPQYMAPPIIEEDGPPSLQPEPSPGGEDGLDLSKIEGKTPSMMPKYKMMQKPSLPQGNVTGDFTYTPTQQEKDRVVERSTTSGQYKCPFCPQELTSVDKIKAHIRKHTGDRPYQCLHCKFNSAYRFVIRTHIKNLHKVAVPNQYKGVVAGERERSLPPTLESCIDTMKSNSPSNLGGLADVYRPVLVDEKRSSPKRFLAAGKVSWDGHFKYIQSEMEKRLILHRCSSTGKYQCPDCSKVLGNIDVMRAHVRTHTGEKPYYCCHCDFQSAHYDSIRKHLIVIHKLKQEEDLKSTTAVDTEWLEPYLKPKPQEPQSSSRKSVPKPQIVKRSPQSEEKYEVDRYRHLFDVVKETTSKKDRKGQTFKRNPLTRAYKCNYCPKESKHHYVIQIHERLHTGEKPYRCRLCEYRGAQQSRIVFHLKAKHADYLEAQGLHQEEPDPVEETEDASIDESIQQEHGDASNQEHYVPKLGVDFTMDRLESEEIQLEKIQQSRIYKCLTCGKRCANAVRTIEHMRQHTGAKPYACTRCSTRSAYDRAIRNHVLLQHGRNAKEKEKLYTFHVGKIERRMELRKHPTTDRFMCPFCGKTFRDVNLAKSHVRMHTGETPYRCKLCKFKGANTRAILVHIERVHGNRGTGGTGILPVTLPTESEVPRKKFKLSDENLPISEGSSNNSFAPSDDDASFKLDEQTVKTNKTYDGPKLGIDFTCDKIETENMYCIDPATGGYKCLYCDRVMKSRHVSKIKNHLLLHTGAKPYKCIHCEFRSAHDGSMRTHVLSRHRKISRAHEKLYKFKVGKIERSLRLDQEPSGAYVCPYCPKRCRDLTVAKKHIRCHTGEKPFRCRKCSYMATMKWSVILHAQRQHKIKKNKSKSGGKPVNKAEVEDDQKLSGIDEEGNKISTMKDSERLAQAASESVEAKSIETKNGGEQSEEATVEKVEDKMVKEGSDTMEVDEVVNSEESNKESKVGEQSNNNVPLSNAPSCENNNESDKPMDDLEVNDKTKTLENTTCEEANEQSGSDSKTVGRLEIDGAEGMITETIDHKDKANNETTPIPKSSENGDAGKLENDSAPMEDSNDAEQQVPGDGSEKREAEAAENRDQEQMEDKADSGIDEESSVNGTKKETDKMDQDALEKTDGQQDEEESNNLQETVKNEMEDVSPSQPPPERSGEPDYIFKQSEEEKSFFKSNASGSFDCPHCTKQFRDIIVMQTHWRNHTGEMPYHCMHCDFKSARFPNIRQHLLLVHKIHRPKSGPKQCEEVPKTVLKTINPSSNEVMVDKFRSLFTFVPSKTSNFKPIRNTASGLFECPICGSTSKRSNGARVHYRTHTGEKPYRCLLCPYKGAQQSRVVTHIKYNHQDEVMGKSVPVLDRVDESDQAEEKEEYEDEDAMMEDDDEEGSLVIDEASLDEEKGVKRKMMDESSTGSGAAKSAHEPMWKKGYEYRPSKAESELVLKQDSSGVFMCPICPHKHKLKNVVRNHIRKHTGEKPYFCCHCDFTTANFSSIRTHLIQAHKSMPHRPDGSPGQDNDAKKIRLDDEEEPPMVEESPTEGYTFTRSLLEKSLRLQRTVKGKYQCPYCVYEYGALAIVMAHVRTHTGDKPFQCNYCPYSAADYSAMRKHLIKKHDKWQPKAKLWSGVVSQAGRETPPELSKEPTIEDGRHGHQDGEHAVQDQVRQSEGLHYILTWGEAEKGLSFHKSETGVYQCPYCPHQHKKKSVVRAHVRTHTGETPYQCKHCTFKCANFSWMREHLIKRHKLKAEQLSNKSKAKESNTSLSLLPDNASLVAQSSAMAQNSDSPVAQSSVGPVVQGGVGPRQKPPKCDFLFAPSDTERHVELSRTNTGSYVCVFCSKELRIINNMRAHIRGHIGDKPYYCTRCPFQSAHISALRRHLFSLHRIRNAKGQKSTRQIALAMTNPPRSPPRIQHPEPIPVIQPLKSSLDAASSPIIHNILTSQPPAVSTPPVHRGLPQQPQLHSPPQRTPSTQPKGPKYIYEETPAEIALLKSLQASNTLQCPHCAHKFSSISRTMEHVRKHTGTKPYRCLVCNFKSAYEGCISRHVSLKHELSAQQLAQFFTFKIGDIEKSIDLRKDDQTGHYQCPFCEKSWPESAKVKRHMCIHTGEKPYRCHLCGFGAVDKSSMVHHLEMSHKKQITQLKDDIAEEQQAQMPNLPPMQISPQQGRTNFTVESKESTKLVLRRVPESQHKLARKLPSPQQTHHNQPSTSSVLKVPTPGNSVPDDTSGYEYKPSQSEQELLHRLNAEGKVRCHYCAKICHSAARTLEHIRMHSGEKPYCCSSCKFASAYEGVMKKHVMVRHGKGTGLSVLYSFKAGKILKSIEFQQEEGTGRYKCPFCRRTMTSLTGAKRHVCTHTGEKPYKCKLCSYCANERSTILWHIDRQHQNAEEHVPDVAQQQRHQQQQQMQQQRKVDPRKAAVTQALGLAPSVTPDQHARSVTPDQHARRSVVSINRRGHIDFNPTPQFRKVRVQPNDTDAISKLFTFEPGKIERSLNLQRDPENGRYLCPFCEQTSRDLTNAKNHVRVHIGEKPFKCKLCDYASVQRSLVIAHIEKHHVVYPSASEYLPQEPLARRRVSSAPRQHKQVASSSFANPHRPPPVSQYTAPAAAVNDMPLDLSKPLDLSSSSKNRQQEPAPPVAKLMSNYSTMASEDVAMDLSAGSRVQEESQESSMDDEEEAALLEAEMLAEEEEEMMGDEEDVTEEDEEMTGDDDEEARLLEEEMLAEEAGEHEAVLSHIDEPEASSGIATVMQKPVSLVKPLNPNEANEDEDSASAEGKSGPSVTIGVVTDANVNPGVMSRSKKSERNIWDMAFNWSSEKKAGEGSEKPSTARTLRYPDAELETDDNMLSADNEELLEVADDVGPGEDSDEAGVLQRLLLKGRAQRDDGDAADADLEHGEAVPDAATAAEDPSTTMQGEVLLAPAITSDDPVPTVYSSNASPLHDVTASQEMPSPNTWQRIQETTPTKPPSSASSALTPDGDTSDGQDEMSSPSSGGLPIITNVMSLNPSLWKSP